ncbi:MAG: DUF445 family protein [Lachnospiraceae bacterium]|nr:DUF445 family protein [Lachnospiraceae bacterium]
MLLRTLAGPLIGSVIGYCTNFIAVKMLFYPRKEIRLFGHRLPFTPGAIPKGKDRLGRAIGKAVGETLLTREDLEKKLLAPEVSSSIAEALAEGLSCPIKSTVKQTVGLTEYDYISGREKICSLLTDQVTDALSRVDLSTIIVEKGIQMIHENLTNPMLLMFVTDDLLHSILDPMGPKVQEMIAVEGPAMIRPVVEEKLKELENQSPSQLLEMMDIQESAVRCVLSSMIQNMLKSSLSRVLDTLDIQKTVEEKVDQMSIEDLEDLVMTIMKKELNTIVNLGALIGLILGLVNLLL